MTELTAEQQAVVERVAKFDYEHHHPRIFWTWEELVKEYPGSAECIRQQAISLLRALGPGVVLKCVRKDHDGAYGIYYEPLLPPEEVK